MTDTYTPNEQELIEGSTVGEDERRRAIARIKAEAVREAAYKFAEGAWQDQWSTDRVEDDVAAVESTYRWFDERADQIEKEAGL